MNIYYSRCSSREELQQILRLQQSNLPSNKTEKEKFSDGFLTVSHSLELLEKMNDVCPHIVAKKEDRLIGYALCMDRVFANEIPILRPMFSMMTDMSGKQSEYMVMGQICIARPFRRKGVFRGLYNFMNSVLNKKYDLIVTEVDAENQRSLQAHYAIGFKDLHVYSSGSRRWHLIGWKL